METPILNENLVGPFAGNDYTSKVNTGNVRLKCRGITYGTTSIRFIQLHAEGFNEREVRMIPSQREDKLIDQHFGPIRRIQCGSIFGYFGYGTREICGDFTNS